MHACSLTALNDASPFAVAQRAGECACGTEQGRFHVRSFGWRDDVRCACVTMPVVVLKSICSRQKKRQKALIDFQSSQNVTVFLISGTVCSSPVRSRVCSFAPVDVYSSRWRVRHHVDGCKPCLPYGTLAQPRPGEPGGEPCTSYRSNAKGAQSIVATCDVGGNGGDA